jgi:hypothetical protein
VETLFIFRKELAGQFELFHETSRWMVNVAKGQAGYAEPLMQVCVVVRHGNIYELDVGV